MKIEFTPIDVETQKVKKSRPCYIELLPDRIIHQFDADIEELKDPDDEMMGWKDSRVYFRDSIKKSSISVIEKSLSQKGNWVVSIGAIGASQDLVIYFNKDNEKSATEMFEKVEAWMFEK